MVQLNKKTFGSVLDFIGNTALLCLHKISSGNVYSKAEYLNPGGSIKDRVAKYIIQESQRMGKLIKGMVIIEAASGNTGIGLSLVGIQLGYRVICVMPENMSEVRNKIVKSFGGEIVLTSAEECLNGCIKTMKEISQADPD